MEGAIHPAGENTAFIGGAPAAFDDAVAQAARLIRESAQPVIAHLGADIAGAREAVLLAERAGAVVDHAASESLLRDLDPVRESGAMMTTPLEAAVRADVALVVGSRFAPDWLSQPARPHDSEVPRRVIRLTAAETGVGAARLAYLATLRARVKQRPARDAAKVEEAAATLRDAKFGVVLWSAEELEPLAIETLHGLVRDLNETTRFSTLSLATPDNGPGVQTVLGWMTGFPLRTGFALGMPQHDPWRYDARRLVAENETDCLIWISAFADGAPPPPGAAIALCNDGAAQVRFCVATPGVETDAILYDPRAGALVATCAATPSSAPSVAETLAAIRARLEATPC